MKNFEILNDKNILLGVTGSIAAYKTPLLVRELVKKGANVHVLMTDSATQFVTPLTLANLSRNKVIIDMFDEESQTSGAWHIELAHKCDAMLIAPCSATTLGKLANAICDSPLISVAIALPPSVPLLISPAMDSTMWMHPATQRSISLIRKDGAVILPPVEGDLSSGFTGPGRFPEINDIISFLENNLETVNLKNRYESNVLYSSKVQYFSKQSKTDEKINHIFEKSSEPLELSIDKDKWNAEFELDQLKKSISTRHINLKGIKILVTAGPTRENIDDVRFISNYSTGKMGFAIAETAYNAGAEVTLISGPVEIDCSAGINRIDVISADEMYSETTKLFPSANLAILSAAVADYTPETQFAGKMKKENLGDAPNILLKKTKDILENLGKLKTESQVLIGFALESDNLIENATEKLKRKNCDMIVANFANKPQSGFGGDFNTITLVGNDSSVQDFLPMTKMECAEIILTNAKKIFEKKIQKQAQIL